MVTTSRHFLVITAVAYFFLGGFVGEVAKVIAHHAFVLLWIEHNLLILVGTVGNVIGLQHLRLLFKSLRAGTTRGEGSGDLENVKLGNMRTRFNAFTAFYVIGFLVFALV
jgi:hypothetical protein